MTVFGMWILVAAMAAYFKALRLANDKIVAGEELVVFGRMIAAAKPKKKASMVKRAKKALGM